MCLVHHVPWSGESRFKLLELIQFQLWKRGVGPAAAAIERARRTPSPERRRPPERRRSRSRSRRSSSSKSSSSGNSVTEKHLQNLQDMKDGKEKQKAYRKLLREWHPDKNPDKAKPEDRSADPEWMEKCMQSQHGLSQNATGKFATTVVEAAAVVDYGHVVGNSEHELSVALGARVFIIDAAAA
eukprot:Skav207624  [mRNA]  locus=scaffold1878:311173:316410:- [translate_table: standard]